MDEACVGAPKDERELQIRLLRRRLIQEQRDQHEWIMAKLRPELREGMGPLKKRELTDDEIIEAGRIICAALDSDEWRAGYRAILEGYTELAALEREE